MDDTDLDDPWGRVVIEVPALTDAQRRFLLGGFDVTPTADDLDRASDEIIDIPSDPDDIEPFHR